LEQVMRSAPGLSDPTLFMHNLASAFITILHLDVGSTEYLLQFGIVKIDPLTRITSVWMGNSLKLLCAIALLCSAIIYRPRKHKPVSVAWVYTLVVIFVSLADLGYLFQVVSLPIRFISLYGPVILFFIIGDSIRIDSSEDAAKETLNLRVGTRLHFEAGPVRHILAVTCLTIILLSTLGSMSYHWNYAVSVPGAYSTISPFSTFLETHSSAESPVVLVGDADFTANLFFIAFTHNATGIVAEPLGTDTILPVYKSLMLGNKGQFTFEISNKGAGFFLFVRNGRPFYADEWGPAFTIPSGRLQSLGLSLVYNDGASQLYSIR